MRIVFDLDGTLADNKHREYYIIATEDRIEPDWDAFFEACDRDRPIEAVVATLHALAQTDMHDIEIWSGRGMGDGDSVWIKTIDWLIRECDIAVLAPHGDWGEKKIFGDYPHTAYVSTVQRLRMRQYNDYTPDDQLKKQWLGYARGENAEPELVFDDRQKVVDMWRAEGIPCFQVAPGDF